MARIIEPTREHAKRFGLKPGPSKSAMSLSIAEAILEAAQVLRRSGVTEARREADSLLAPVLGQDRTFLITHAGDVLTPEALTVLRDWTNRRASGEPLQYITGHQDFFGLDFEVNHDVLIPRPETELLVETALGLIGEKEPGPLICDVGTGSGCIIVALLHERSKARGLAVDISPAALRVALRNATRLQVSERATFVEADCFAAFTQGDVRFDMIVSNPPYVPARELPTLQREVRDHEPLRALVSGDDGLAMIRRLLSEAPPFLIDNGYMVLEIGYDQRAAVKQLIDARVWKLLDIGEDLQGIPRTVTLEKLGS